MRRLDLADAVERICRLSGLQAPASGCKTKRRHVASVTSKPNGARGVRHFGVLAVLLALVFFVDGPAVAALNSINFDAENDGDLVTSTYPGLTITNNGSGGAFARFNSFATPPSNVISVNQTGSPEFNESDGAVEIAFASPQQSVAVSVAAVADSDLFGSPGDAPYMEVFDTANNRIGPPIVFQGALPALSGEITAFETLSFDSPAANIARIRLSVPTSQPSSPIRALFDDLQYGRGPAVRMAAETLSIVEGAAGTSTVQFNPTDLVDLAAEFPNALQATFVLDLAFSGSAIPGSDFTFGGAGQTVTGSQLRYTLPDIASLPSLGGFGIPISAVLDSFVESVSTSGMTVTAGTVELSLPSRVGPPSIVTRLLAAEPASVTNISITDSVSLPPLPPVASVAATANASEIGPSNGTVLFSIDQAQASNLVLNYTVSGTATAGLDYQSLFGSITIPAGETAVSLDIVPLSDLDAEPDEDVTISLVSDIAYQIGANASASVTIADNPPPPPPLPPTASVTATADAAELGPVKGAVTFSIDAPQASDLVLHYFTTGSATDGVDYQSLSGNITIPAGQSSVSLDIIPLADSDVESDEDVTIFLSSDPGYQISANIGAAVIISDNPPPLPPVVSVSAAANAAESGPTSGTLTFSVDVPQASDLLLQYAVSGTAAPGLDYQSLSGAITIPAGQSTVSLDIVPLADYELESGEDVTIALLADAAYQVGANSSASVTISDGPPPPATISITSPTLVNQSKPVISGTTDLPAGSNLQVIVDLDNNPSTTGDLIGFAGTVPVGGAWSVDTANPTPNFGTLPPEGFTGTVGVTVELAGFSSIIAAQVLTIDLLPPNLTVATPIGDGNLSASEDAAVVISGTSSGTDGGTVALTVTDSTSRQVSGSAAIQIDGSWSTTLNLSTLGDGPLGIVASATDSAGNTGSETASVDHDRAAPTLAIDPVGDGNLSAGEDDGVTLSGTSTGAENQTVDVTIADGRSTPVVTQATVDPTGIWSVAGVNLSSLADGTLTLTATVSDAAGNAGSATPVTVLHDTVFPTLIITTPIGDGNLSAGEDAIVAIGGTGSGADGQLVTVTVSDAGSSSTSGTATLQVDGTWSLQLNFSTLGDGPLAVSANVSDPAGNVGGVSASVDHDTTAPTLIIGLVGDGNLSGSEDDSVTISGTSTGAVGSAVNLSIGDGTATPINTTATVQSGGDWSVQGLNLSSLTGVVLTVTATVGDAAGNTATDSQTVRHDPVVSLTADDPAASEVGPGLAVFTMQLDRPAPPGGLTVDLLLDPSSTATADDFSGLPASVAFLAGEVSKTITLTPLADGLVEGPETAVLTLLLGTDYLPGTAFQASATVADAPANDLPTLQLPVGGRVRLTLIASNSGYYDTLSVTTPGVAIAFSDCAITPGSGAAVKPVLTGNGSGLGCTTELDADPTKPGAQPFGAGAALNLELCVHTSPTAPCSFRFASPRANPADFDAVTIQPSGAFPNAFDLAWEDTENGDDDFADLVVRVEVTPPAVSIEAPRSAASEMGPGSRQFLVSLDQPAPPGGLSVAYGLHPATTAAEGADFEALPGSIDIAAGQTVGYIPVNPQADTFPEDPESVVLELQPGLGYKLPALDSQRIAALTLADTTPLPGDWSVLQLAAGDGFTCALLTDGSVKCWGRNDQGQLGSGDTRDRGTLPADLGNTLPRVDLGTGRRAVAIAAGSANACAILDDGNLKCWGSNAHGELGLGDTRNRGGLPGELGDALPSVPLAPGRRATQVAMGSHHTCARLDDGSMQCWGWNGNGQLGLGDLRDRGAQPREMGAALPFVDLGGGLSALEIAAGSESTCARLNDGTVKCWGRNDLGQLGLGDSRNRGGNTADMGDALAFVGLEPGRPALQLTSMSAGFCALLDDGGVRCWGDNSAGNLGQGDLRNRGGARGDMGVNLLPVDLGSGRAAQSIASHGQRVCAILDDGQTKCWGSNSHGGLGLGDTENRGDQAAELGDALPVLEIPLATVLAIGSEHGCAIGLDRRVQCWGGNAAGALGLGVADIDDRGDAPGEMGILLPTVDLGGPLPDILATIQATDPTASEVGAEPGNFTFTLSRPAPTEGVLIAYLVEGSATAGIDYLSISGSVSIPPGEIAAHFNLTPIADNQVEGPESVTLRLQSGANYQVGTAGAATVEIADTPLPFATIFASDGLAAEDDLNPAEFTVALERPAPDGGISVNLAFGGSATADDYVPSSATVTILAGESIGFVRIAPTYDNRVEGAESVLVTILPGDHYQVGAPDTASAELVDTPLPLASVTALDGSGAEAGGDTITFLVSLDQAAPAGGVLIRYAMGGSGLAGQDYVNTVATLFIAESETSASLIVTPLSDTSLEGSETVLLEILPGDHYLTDLGSQAVASIADQPPTRLVSVEAADPEGAEKGRDPGEFRVVLSEPAPDGGLSIGFSITGSATEGEDFDALDGSVVIPAGATSALLPVQVRADRLREGLEKVVINLHAGSGYQLGTGISANVTIADAARAIPSAECQARQLATAIALAGDFAQCQRVNLRNHDGETYESCKFEAEITHAAAIDDIVETSEDCDLTVAGSDVADLWGSLIATVTDPLVDAWDIPSPVAFRQAARSRRFVTVSKVVERNLKAAVRAEVRFLRDGNAAARNALMTNARNGMVRRLKNLAAGRRDYTGPKGPDFSARITKAVEALVAQVRTPDQPEALQLALGDDFGCVRLNTLALKCWGQNDAGQLGIGDTLNRGDAAGEMGGNLPEIALGSGRRVLDLAVGKRHACALLKGGAVKCWGDNTYGQLGLGDTAARGDQPEDMGDQLPEVDLGTAHHALRVYAGGDQSCAMLEDGSLKCWGRNHHGQLGQGDRNHRGDQALEMGDFLPAISLGSDRLAVDLSVGGEHACARFDDGAVKCWGGNGQGTLALGDRRDRGALPGEMGDALPIIATGVSGTAVAAGDGYTCMLGNDGLVRCWGRNDEGQLGLGDTADRIGDAAGSFAAVDLGRDRHAVDLEAGARHVCARLDDQTMKCWGANDTGQLGLGDSLSRGATGGPLGDALPTVDFGTFGVIAEISLGRGHGCARNENGAVRCWGGNAFGDLGLGDTQNRGDQTGEMGDALPVLDFGPAASASP